MKMKMCVFGHYFLSKSFISLLYTTQWIIIGIRIATVPFLVDITLHTSNLLSTTIYSNTKIPIIISLMTQSKYFSNFHCGFFLLRFVCMVLLYDSTSEIHYANQQHVENKIYILCAIKIALHHFIELHLQLIKLLLLCR